MIRGIADAFARDGRRSEVTYDPSMPDTLQSMLDWSKTAHDLGYAPEYGYEAMLEDFKREMEEEPLAQLWGTGADYEALYGGCRR